MNWTLPDSNEIYWTSRTLADLTATATGAILGVVTRKTLGITIAVAKPVFRLLDKIPLDS